MLARDIMTTEVVSVPRDAAVSEIAGILLRNRISAVPVVDDDSRVLGMVSEGDLMRRPETGAEPRHSWWLRLLESPDEHAAEYAKSHGLRAEDVMTGNVISVTEDTPVGEIAAILEERRIKRVPVLRDGRIVGIVSRASLLQALAIRPSLGPDPSDDDRTLREGILDEVRRNAKADIEFIGVTVDGGIAHIWGIADSAEEKKAIRVAAENVVGASRVKGGFHRWEDIVGGAAIANIAAYVFTDTLNENVVVIPVVDMSKKNFGIFAGFRF